MPKKRRKRTEREKLIKQVDDLWSIAVKVRAGYKCEISGKTNHQTRLNSHHFITRDVKALRFDMKNGVCLGAGEHTLSRHSAHKAPKWFEGQMLEVRHDDWNYCQEHKWDTKKWTIDELKEKKEELKRIISEGKVL